MSKTLESVKEAFFGAVFYFCVGAVFWATSSNDEGTLFTRNPTVFQATVEVAAWPILIAFSK